jgi:hypothetical protein
VRRVNTARECITEIAFIDGDPSPPLTRGGKGLVLPPAPGFEMGLREELDGADM